MIFTRALLYTLFSFIKNARATYTAATRHLSANVQCFSFRRQDEVQIGTAMLRVFITPPETARCPICRPSPKFILIHGQALRCTDPDDVHPARDEAQCPVLDIPASKLCVPENAALRAAIFKVLRSSTPLTDTQLKLLRGWHLGMMTREQETVEGGAAYLFFKFFALDGGLPLVRGGEQSINKADEDPKQPSPVATSANLEPSSRRKRKEGGSSRAFENALRLDADGVVALGGKIPAAAKPIET